MNDFFSFNIGQIGQVLVLLTALWLQVKEQNKRLEKIESEMAQLREVMITVARQDERLNAMDQRMLSQGKRIDNLQYARWKTPEETAND